MPIYGVSLPTDGSPAPPGFATLIPESGISVDGLDRFVTGWMTPTFIFESKLGTERIEDGSTITDHVVPMPSRLRLTGMVSDMAMGAPAAGRAWAEVERLHKEKTILSVITELLMLKEMVIKTAQTSQTGRGLEFTIELQQIVRVGVSASAEAAGFPDNPANGRGALTDGGSKGLIEAPITLLGNDRIRIGSPTDPGARTVRVGPNGEALDDETGDPITGDNGQPLYFTIPPAE